ncbi:hypothetical protein LX81_03866 [Palleronia aestuarii]|uniref:Uncharacterized protein n=1 Tax=Palleronia aestuarii TaxID=568105 RepID=A0A2W7PQS0_9RHOB|nr:hypothetical protein [Palleronia aestuarii]PZX11789.1 hypothetical protein LX81_03866 [Palleronia aestuarii]
MHHFTTGDLVTDQNLGRLDHLADLAQLAPGPEQMHNWLLAVIGSKEMLPPAVAQQIKGNFYLGDLHYKWSEEFRTREWTKLIEGLRRDIDQLALQDLTVTATDRPCSRGETIVELCDELDAEGHGTLRFNTLVRRLRSIAVYDTVSDARTLERLAKRKKVDPYEITRTIHHLKLVARRMFYVKD